MEFAEILAAIENTALATVVRESAYGFPVLVGIHIMALTISVGMLLWFDLRLLGVVLGEYPVSQVYRQLAPWLLTGFAVMFASGAVLFSGFATAAAGNLAFRVKLAAMLAAGANAMAFHFITQRRAARWDRWPVPPPAARAAGLVSILMWVVVIVCGRLMSYTMF